MAWAKWKVFKSFSSPVKERFGRPKVANMEEVAKLGVLRWTTQGKNTIVRPGTSTQLVRIQAMKEQTIMRTYVYTI